MSKYILAVFTIMVFIGGCTKESLQENLSLDIDAFHEVVLNSSFDIYLTEGSEYSIKIVADKSVVDFVKFEVVDSVLVIDNERSFKWLKPTKNKIKVYITSPPLSTVTANETCFIRTLTPITSSEFGLILKNKANNADLDLNCNIFYYWNSHPCGGTLDLKGDCQTLKLWNVALVNVEAENLNAQDAIVSNASKGSCIVRVSNSLTYVLSGEGNIEVYGSPLNIIESEPATSTGELILH